jgi:hypothetical protein
MANRPKENRRTARAAGGFSLSTLPDDPLDNLARLEQRDTKQCQHSAENRFRRKRRVRTVTGRMTATGSGQLARTGACASTAGCCTG